MFSFLIHSISSYKFHNVTYLTSNNWNKEIEHRKNGSVYFVIFHGEHCPACQATYPLFQEMVDAADGMIKFGNVDTSKEQYLATKFLTYTIPTLIVFHKDGYTKYEGSRNPKQMLRYVSKFIPKLVDKIPSEEEEEWLPKEGKKEAILFSTKAKRAPTLWNALAASFEGSGIKFGYSNNQDFMEQFDVSVGPTVVLVSGENTSIYDGEIGFSSIQNAIGAYFPNSLSDRPKQNKKTVHNPATVLILKTKDDFNSVCKGRGFFCIIHGSDEIDPIFQNAAKMYRNDPFRFFICNKNCPYKNLQNGIKVIHSRRNAFIDIPSLNDLGSYLDRIIDGGAKWTNTPTEL